jgi:hypothetical protein
MDGLQHYSFACADFIDNDAGAGGEKKIEYMPEFINIKTIIENLVQATTNTFDFNVSNKSNEERIRELKKLFCIENLNLIEPFLNPIHEHNSYNKLLEISDTLSNELFNSYSKGVFDFLNIDLSGNYENFDKEIGMPLDTFKTALDNLNVSYKNSLLNLFKADIELRNAINIVQKLLSQINIIINLEINENTQDLLISTAKYVHTTISNINLYNLFLNFVNSRKAFITYRQLIKNKDVTNTIENEPTCSICMNNSVKQIAIPCGHTFCDKCIFNQQTCYICRSKIEKKHRVFFN